MKRAWFGCLLPLGFWLACTVGETPCRSTPDCPVAWVCHEGKCLLPSSKEGLSPDAPDASEASVLPEKEEPTHEARTELPPEPSLPLCKSDSDCPVLSPKCQAGRCYRPCQKHDQCDLPSFCSPQVGFCLPCEDGGARDKKEFCDGLDNDCDGQVDEDLTRPCASSRGCVANADETYTCEGLCKPGLQKCDKGFWQTCQGDTAPQAEKCDGHDNDCDGQTDEDLLHCTYRLPTPPNRQSSYGAIFFDRPRDRMLLTGGENSVDTIFFCTPAGRLLETLRVEGSASVSISSVSVAPSGEIYIAETGSGRIKKYDPRSKTTVNIDSFDLNQGPAWLATNATSLVVAQNSFLRVLDFSGNQKLKVGQNTGGFQDGSASTAMFQSIRGIAFHSKGDLWIGDGGPPYSRIRTVSASGQVTTVCEMIDNGGNPVEGSCGTAQINSLKAVGFGLQDTFFFSDSYATRKMDSSRTISRVGGAGSSIAFDSKGYLYVYAGGGVFRTKFE